MEKKNSNGILIGLLIGIIIMLLIVVALFATNTINFKTSSDNKKSIENTINNSNDDKSNIENNHLDNDKFSSIIEEYKKAMNDTTYLDSTNNEEKYPNVNNNMMHFYHNHLNGTYDGKVSFYYSYYDINKDSNNELIIAYDKYNIAEIYTYDGNKPVRSFNENCLGERCSVDLYENGIILFRGSGGASHHYISFYNINKNTSTLNTINTYYLEYEENGNVTIYDEKTYDTTNNTGTKSKYKSEEELLSANIGNKQKIDLEKLTWEEIK